MELIIKKQKQKQKGMIQASASREVVWCVCVCLSGHLMSINDALEATARPCGALACIGMWESSGHRARTRARGKRGRGSNGFIGTAEQLNRLVIV